MGSPAILQALAIAILLVLVVWFSATLCRNRGREGFASKEARRLCAGATQVFADNRRSYSDLNKKVGCDIVQHSDMLALFDAGRLTPERVQRIM